MPLARFRLGKAHTGPFRIGRHHARDRKRVISRRQTEQDLLDHAFGLGLGGMKAAGTGQSRRIPDGEDRAVVRPQPLIDADAGLRRADAGLGEPQRIKRRRAAFAIDESAGCQWGRVRSSAC